jgi:hypothetical protein
MAPKCERISFNCTVDSGTHRDADVGRHRCKWTGKPTMQIVPGFFFFAIFWKMKEESQRCVQTSNRLTYFSALKY